MTDQRAASLVADVLGLEVRATGTTSPSDLDDVVAVALRQNPQRRHLLVSRVLAKHVPAAPAAVRTAGIELGRRVREALDGDRPGLVLGFAETATALGHLVADELEAPYIHSTRRAEGAVAAFTEVHSHATTHYLAPHEPSILAAPGPVVVVDDEFSTGRTAIAAVEVLQRFCPRDRYVLASLVDVAGGDEAFEQAGRRLGAELSRVSTVTGRVEGLASDGEPTRTERELRARRTDLDVRSDGDPREARWQHLVVPVPRGTVVGGGHGFLPTDRPALDGLSREVADAVVARMPGLTGVHVLGTEELMYFPLVLAERLTGRLAERADGPSVTVSSTTRSPVVVIDDDGYPIRDGVRFAAHDGVDPAAARFAYNLRQGNPEALVVVTDASAPVDLLDALAARAQAVLLVQLEAARS